jgi:hypothetical protein
MSWVKFGDRISVQDGALRFAIKRNASGLGSGAAFRANPRRVFPSDSCSLSYSVFFPPNFDFVKGGKLPGVCFGSKGRECSTGGKWSKDAGSFRVMFREKGAAIGYVYMALGSPTNTMNQQSAEFKAVAKTTRKTGINLWHNPRNPTFRMLAGSWNAVLVQIRLNSPSSRDGWLSMTINGKTMRLDGLTFRTSSSVRVDTLNFVTFLGGSGKEWESKVDSYILFKDVIVSGNTG